MHFMLHTFRCLYIICIKEIGEWFLFRFWNFKTRIRVEENVLLKLHHIDSQFAAHPFKLKLRLLLKRLPDFSSHFNLFSHSLLENPPPIRIAGRVYLNFRCTSVQPEAAGSKFQSVPPFAVWLTIGQDTRTFGVPGTRGTRPLRRGTCSSWGIEIRRRKLQLFTGNLRSFLHHFTFLRKHTRPHVFPNKCSCK